MLDYDFAGYQEFLADTRASGWESDDSSIFDFSHACSSPPPETNDPWSLGDRTPGAKLPFVRETAKTLRLYYVPENAILLPDSVRRGGCYFYLTDVHLPHLGRTAYHPRGDSLETTGQRSKRTTYFRNGIRMQGPPSGVAVYEFR